MSVQTRSRRPEDHGLHLWKLSDARDIDVVLNQARCECGWRSAWMPSEDRCCGNWERHLSRCGVTVDAILTAKGRT